MLFHLNDVDNLIYDLLDKVEKELQTEQGKSVEDESSSDSPHFSFNIYFPTEDKVKIIQADLNNVQMEHNYCLPANVVINIQANSSNTAIPEEIKDKASELKILLEAAKSFKTVAECLPALNKTINDVSKTVERINHISGAWNDGYVASYFKNVPNEEKPDVLRDRVKVWLAQSEELYEKSGNLKREILENDSEDIDEGQSLKSWNIDRTSDLLSEIYPEIANEKSFSIPEISTYQDNYTLEDEKENRFDISARTTNQNLKTQTCGKRKDSRIRLGISKKQKTDEASLRWKQSLFREDADFF